MAIVLNQQKPAFIIVPSYAYPTTKASAIQVARIDRLFPVYLPGQPNGPMTRIFTGTQYCETNLTVDEILALIDAAFADLMV